jgi:UDP-2,4-diacetamido-2,4,6-trideoxy-beta-L-altropyranose hydrolase
MNRTLVNQKVAFRVDASSEIGTGHLMRCLTLADMLKRDRCDVCFVCRHIPLHLQRIVESNHELVILNRVDNVNTVGALFHSDWLGVSQEQDAIDSIAALSHQLWDWIVVDHYAIDYIWESAMKSGGIASKLLVIDDLADRNHVCDILLDQNLRPNLLDSYVDKVPKECIRLLGPRFALLRPEFLKHRPEDENGRGKVETILVFFGGVDVNNYTGVMLDILADELKFDGRVNVIVGSGHPFLNEIRAKCDHEGFSCYVQTTDIAALMASADLFLGAGGTSVWERCCVGLPGVSIATAFNQEEQIQNGAKAGLFLAPDSNEKPVAGIKWQVACLIHNLSLRRLLAKNSMTTVDGLGVNRVCSILRGEGISVREAGANDVKNMFEWRNNPQIRNASKNSELISFADHKNWFSSTSKDKNKIILIGEFGDTPMGVVRFDFHENEIEVSIYLVPDQPLAIGMGIALLKKCEEWLMFKCKKSVVLVAEILNANHRSEKMFLTSGYSKYKTVFLKELVSVKS